MNQNDQGQAGHAIAQLGDGLAHPQSAEAGLRE
jgi:hypothetical protein